MPRAPSQALILSVVLALGVVSCTHVPPQSDAGWPYIPQRDKAWSRIIPEFRVQDMPIREAARLLETEANRLPGPNVRIHVTEEVARSPLRVTVAETNAPLGKVLWEVTRGSSIYYRGRQAKIRFLDFLDDVFSTSIRTRGRIRGGAPSEFPPQVFVARHSGWYPQDQSLAAPVASDGSFEALVQVRVGDEKWDGSRDFREERVSIYFTAIGHTWCRRELALTNGTYEYPVEIKLEPLARGPVPERHSGQHKIDDLHSPAYAVVNIAGAGGAETWKQGRSSWNYGKMPDRDPWSRVIPVIAFEDTPLPEALSYLQAEANRAGGLPVELRTGPLLDRQERVPCATINSRNEKLGRALVSLAGSSGVGIRYRDRSAELENFDFLWNLDARRPEMDKRIALSVAVTGTVYVVPSATKTDSLLMVVGTEEAPRQALATRVGQDGSFRFEFLVPAEESGPRGKLALPRARIKLQFSSPGFGWYEHLVTLEPDRLKYPVEVTLPEAGL